MDECAKQRLLLSKKFKECQKTFIALGDETRQQIFISLLESEHIGMRVGEITKCTHLSRPAVSHHLQILKDAKIISMHRKGTMNYYYVDANQSQWSKFTELVDHVNAIVQAAVDLGYPRLWEKESNE